jgi:hypothetical protein
MHQPSDPSALPLFAEFINVERLVRRQPSELAELSIGLLKRYLARRPRTNPIARFGESLADWLPRLREQGMDQYHLWAFGSVRQIGASLELLAGNLQWLNQLGVLNCGPSVDSLQSISSGCKTLILKGARAVATGRSSGLAEACKDMAAAWDAAVGQLDSALAEKNY